MDVQTLRAEAFKALHAREGAFVIPNPWDAGSAKLLASLGFEALATTSAGLAFSLGRPDAEGALSLDDTLDNAGEIVDATALPVAADLENGFGDLPKPVPRPSCVPPKSAWSVVPSKMPVAAAMRPSTT
jgi:2-methylisocitrate lyase-like PEP mutase family enzyme